jgi:L-lactate dehydrogenase complex protein LldE
VKNAAVSTAMAQDKVSAVIETGAGVCTAADNSCLMQIGGALARTGSAVRCVHLAEILAATAGDATR